MVEERFVARVTRDGRVTIPLRVRDVLGVRDGDYIRMTVTEIVKKKSKFGDEQLGFYT
jgi:bifunctional DNA-binding transcriptional regulator/antitoxin component of YhaV-PrlF toxin-antitoxin module